MPAPPADPLTLHAAATGEAPWLFVRRGWDWRWISFAEGEARAAAAAARLASTGVAGRVAYLWRPEAAQVVLDIALRRAGLDAVPVAEGELAPAAAAAGAGAWAEPVDPDDRIPGAEAPAGLPRLAVDLSPPQGGSGGPPTTPGGAVVGSRQGSVRHLAAAAVARAGQDFADSLGRPATGRREVVVLHRSLALAEERAAFAWALAAGAALVLEPHPQAAVATAAWARPTVFWGEAASVSALVAQGARPGLRDRLRRMAGRPPLLPFGRLRTVLVAGEPGDELRRLCRERGVRLLSLSSGAPRDGGEGACRGAT